MRSASLPCQRLHKTTSPFYIAVTGHRDLQSKASAQFVANAFDILLHQLRQVHGSELVALSGLAEGADTLFAEAALRLSIPLEAIIAHQNLLDDFPPGFARTHFLQLRAQSCQVHILPFVDRSIEAYSALGRLLVDRCALLLAAWNGLPAPDAGGTGGVVAYAQQRRRPIVHIHTLKHTISPLAVL